MYEAVPENREILAKYEDITSQFHARVNEIGEEFAQRMATIDAEAQQRAREAAEQLAEFERAREAAKAEAAQEVAPKPTWERQERKTVLSFGAEEDVAEAAPAPPPRPSFTPPPAEPPAPEPVRSPAPNRVLSFGVDEDDDAPAPRHARPAPRRPAPRANDDEDWSNQSWMR